MSNWQIVLVVLAASIVSAEIAYRLFVWRHERQNKEPLKIPANIEVALWKTEMAIAKQRVKKAQLETLARQYNLDISVVESVCEVMGDESISDGTLAKALSSY